MMADKTSVPQTAAQEFFNMIDGWMNTHPDIRKQIDDAAATQAEYDHLIHIAMGHIAVTVRRYDPEGTVYERIGNDGKCLICGEEIA